MWFFFVRNGKPDTSVRVRTVLTEIEKRAKYSFRFRIVDGFLYAEITKLSDTDGHYSVHSGIPQGERGASHKYL